MLDASQVTRFAARLHNTPDPSFVSEWREEWSQKVADDMRRLAPVATGALRASIHPDAEGVSVGVAYAAYVEYGTADTAPQPFVNPAIEGRIRPAADDAGRRVLQQL